MSQVRAELLIDEELLAEAREFARECHITIDQVFNEAAVEALRNAGRLPASDSGAARMHTACDAMGYTDYHAYPSGRDACIAKFAFTAAILADITQDGYGDRWCYANIEQARAALEAWDGANDTEPQGWHRHPDTGRRRPNGDASREYISI